MQQNLKSRKFISKSVRNIRKNAAAADSSDNRTSITSSILSSSQFPRQNSIEGGNGLVYPGYPHFGGGGLQQPCFNPILFQMQQYQHFLLQQNQLFIERN
mmetsp:Transcript_3045/g.5136  ORF Transcript_3045/g.5136 Transcript_3045/m.5136 type:complete len:100 (+) Transcript_3045:813-1112(+)